MSPIKKSIVLAAIVISLTMSMDVFAKSNSNHSDIVNSGNSGQGSSASGKTDEGKSDSESEHSDNGKTDQGKSNSESEHSNNGNRPLSMTSLILGHEDFEGSHSGGQGSEHPETNIIEIIQDPAPSTTIPEPGTLFLMVLGSLGLMRKRRS